MSHPRRLRHPLRRQFSNYFLPPRDKQPPPRDLGNISEFASMKEIEWWSGCSPEKRRHFIKASDKAPSSRCPLWQELVLLLSAEAGWPNNVRIGRGEPTANGVVLRVKLKSNFDLDEVACEFECAKKVKKMPYCTVRDIKFEFRPVILGFYLCRCYFSRFRTGGI